MTSKARRRPATPFAGAFLTLLAFGLLAPASARAGCVHDALGRSQQPAGAAHFDRLIAMGAMPMPDGDPAPRPFEPATPGRPRPCSGPTCSNDSGVPPVPTATLAPASPSWAWAGQLLDADGPASDLLPRREGLSRPVHRGPSIFHPPRTSFA